MMQARTSKTRSVNRKVTSFYKVWSKSVNNQRTEFRTNYLKLLESSDSLSALHAKNVMRMIYMDKVCGYTAGGVCSLITPSVIEKANDKT